MTVANSRLLTRRRRRILLTLHIALSVGWLGASMVMLTLAVAARAGQPEDDACFAYWAMHLVSQWLLMPLSVTVLLVGVLLAVTTPWGLLRHWWVLTKLIGTSAAVILSLFALPAMTGSAYRSATENALAAEASAGTRLIIAGCFSVALYLSMTAVSVWKPWGRTDRGRRLLEGSAPARPPSRRAGPSAVTAAHIDVAPVRVPSTRVPVSDSAAAAGPPHERNP